MLILLCIQIILLLQFLLNFVPGINQLLSANEGKKQNTTIQTTV